MEDMHIEETPDLHDSAESAESTSDASRTQEAYAPLHACVLIHGLWGHPDNLSYMESTLRRKYGSEALLTLCCTSNSGGRTYDGIDACAERAFQEVEAFLSLHARKGRYATRFSVCGYSLGGLIARYLVGMLLRRGWFKRMKPINFTTVACPHLGVWLSDGGVTSWMWNNVASRSISVTGQQLCGIDDFRGTHRSLLSILADPQTSFIRGLRMFETRSLYTNITNDRFATHFSSNISQSYPYVDLQRLNISYLEGFESVMLDPAKPSTLRKDYLGASGKGLTQRLFSQGWRRGSIALGSAVLGPIVVSILLIYSAVETSRSKSRLKTLKQKTPFGTYHDIIPLEDGSPPTGFPTGAESASSVKLSESEEMINGKSMSETAPIEAHNSLRLTGDQLIMMKSLNDVGFEKHLVHIKTTQFSHSAIIVRSDREMFSEGKAVIDHWIQHVFKI